MSQKNKNFEGIFFTSQGSHLNLQNYFHPLPALMQVYTGKQNVFASAGLWVCSRLN